MANLIDFVLMLFRDPVAATNFVQDPGRALNDAGLPDVTPEQVEGVAAAAAPAGVVLPQGDPVSGLQTAVAEFHGFPMASAPAPFFSAGVQVGAPAALPDIDAFPSFDALPSFDASAKFDPASFLDPTGAAPMAPTSSTAPTSQTAPTSPTAPTTPTTPPPPGVDPPPPGGAAGAAPAASQKLYLDEQPEDRAAYFKEHPEDVDKYFTRYPEAREAYFKDNPQQAEAYFQKYPEAREVYYDEHPEALHAIKELPPGERVEYFDKYPEVREAYFTEYPDDAFAYTDKYQEARDAEAHIPDRMEFVEEGVDLYRDNPEALHNFLDQVDPERRAAYFDAHPPDAFTISDFEKYPEARAAYYKDNPDFAAGLEEPSAREAYFEKYPDKAATYLDTYPEAREAYFDRHPDAREPYFEDHPAARNEYLLNNPKEREPYFDANPEAREAFLVNNAEARKEYFLQHPDEKSDFFEEHPEIPQEKATITLADGTVVPAEGDAATAIAPEPQDKPLPDELAAAGLTPADAPTFPGSTPSAGREDTAGAGYDDPTFPGSTTTSAGREDIAAELGADASTHAAIDVPASPSFASSEDESLESTDYSAGSNLSSPVIDEPYAEPVIGVEPADTYAAMPSIVEEPPQESEPALGAT